MQSADTETAAQENPDDPFCDLPAIGSPPPSTHSWPDPIMNFLVAYDIADPKRLRLVAKLMEASARRVQKSLFVYTGTRRGLDGLIRGVVQEIDPVADRVQAWPIRTSSRSQRVDGGSGHADTGVAVIISPDQTLVIEAIDEADSPDHEPIML